ncbi:D-alanyl-lipoteichoic acid acyltransferase DltB (MBOAT superfamily) [Algoriphagus ratkowskyi]|uniref:D-alanyl-lipoteichoic acid acyltransferase DltB (MBOAT superfamily) n=1 Tax=Algoriphagus ratkowskyi TaxID=57028 RepID=A0A2W7RA36_9BACT|nr:MBOAT family O-acyltransferase [Algoriphagus ratkowskyi]PZX57803.1 D-alanyl-lipoteichoic acid acyltransferase DltB (MBOAT superfamily) [Algoriphagus ratkowskyi]TXD79067.1 MBOAT family protein [Algoriphagus ratkowskyi]
MLFNSIDFAIFLPIVFILYWFASKGITKYQNFLILVSSYVFYGWWDWRFLFLIFFSSLLDYFIGVALFKQQDERKRKVLLWVSICVNLGFLGFFKYFNFFIENFNTAFTFFGNPISNSSLNIILPVGISFYTFQTLSYSIDVYKRKIKPTTDFVAFSAFVSFFPQLVAGPIERASNLLPQFENKRTFEYSKAVDGLRQILWGLFKKVVIADNCAESVNYIFNNSDSLSGSTLFLGGVLFAFQIYGDFSGYSDIAIGTSRLFGFNLMRNFAFPYFSRDIAEFWRRWHISLSTWFRDYLYIPLGGSKGGMIKKIRNTFIIFVVSGFWHGANWTFVFWGFLNALYFLPLLLSKRNRVNMDIVAKGRVLPSMTEFGKMGLTFGLTVLAWIFFRADNITHAFTYLSDLFSSSFFNIPEHFPKTTLGLLIIFIIVEWIGREEEFALASIGFNWPRKLRLVFYYSIILALFVFSGEQQQFIYFQF